MDTSKSDQLKYYNKRIIEFDKLLAQAKSQTLIDLLTKAKQETERNISKLINVQKAIITYLKAYEISNDGFLKQFNDQLVLCSVEVKKNKRSGSSKRHETSCFSSL